MSCAVFVIMLVYFFFKQHQGVNANAFDKSLMFFAGMSASSMITFAKNIFNYAKNTELVTQIKNSVNDVKVKKAKALEDLTKQTESLEPEEPKVEPDSATSL